jgi:hypothetical protein
VVFLQEPLRLTLRERVCLLGKVALEFKPRGQGILLLSHLMSYLAVGFKYSADTNPAATSYDFIEYNNCSRVMQAPEPSF